MPTAKPLDAPVVFGLTGVDEVLQNVAVILATPRGSVPLDRGFGADWEAVDLPLPLAAARLRQAVVDAIERDEPRARVTAVTFERRGDGQLRPTVTIDIDLDA